MSDTNTPEPVQQQAPAQPAAQSITTTNQESKNTSLLIWIGTIFFGFIPSLILYLIKKDDAYVQDQAKEALNLSITMLIGYFISAILAVIVIGIVFMLILSIANLVFCIMGAVKTSKGESFRAPFILRLIK